MMKSVHHVIDFTGAAHRRYWRESGQRGPMPASGYEAAEHDGKDFVVVSNIDGPLAIYRIDFRERDGLVAATDEEAVTVSKLLGYVSDAEALRPSRGAAFKKQAAAPADTLTSAWAAVKSPDSL